MGEVFLPVIPGKALNRHVMMIRFLVMDTQSSCNMVMGRPSLNKFEVVMLTYHQEMKLPIGDGIWDV